MTRPAPGRDRLEYAGYAATAVLLAVLLVVQVGRADRFYLDEWMYTHAAEYMWDRFPQGVFEQIPNWLRGPQRLYSLLLAPLWGGLATPAAYAWSHLLNVALLVSTVVPAALFARRIIENAWLRVLAVALAVGVPWLVIGVNLLTENLAFPLFMWTVLAITAAADDHGWRVQLLAPAAVVALALTRLNLGVMAAVLVLAVIVAELVRVRSQRGEPGRARAFVRRRTPLLLVASALVLVAVAALATGRAALGSYDFTSEGFLQGKWEQRELILSTAYFYTRGLIVGGFVFPFAIGVAAALAALRGALGPRARIPALVALTSWLAVVLVVSVWTAGAALEERYAFYVYAPLAIFAVAGAAQIRRIVPELAVASALTAWILARGASAPALDSGNFFAAPAGAFWTRVVEYRLVLVDRALFDFLPGEHAYVPVAAGLAAFVLVVAAAALLRRPWMRIEAVVGAGLALCVVAQVLVVNYDFQRILTGTTDRPGGFAGNPGHAGERDDWLDDTIPAGASAAMVPPPVGGDTPLGTAEYEQFWNRRIDAVLALPFTAPACRSRPGTTRSRPSSGRTGSRAGAGRRTGTRSSARTTRGSSSPGRCSRGTGGWPRSRSPGSRRGRCGRPPAWTRICCWAPPRRRR